MLKKNPEVEKIYALPGNGGIAQDAECVNIKATDIDGVTRFAAENHIDFAVIAPDDPLAMGCVDRLHALGIPCFGPEGARRRDRGQQGLFQAPDAEVRHPHGQMRGV